MADANSEEVLKNNSDKEEVKSSAKRKTQRETDDENKESHGNSDDEEDSPKNKKPKTTEETDPSATVIHTTSEGEKYVDLGKKKRATVRKFKGSILVDIREFYDAGGQEKPGKKGISLSHDQWRALKKASSTIDSLLSET